MIKQVEISLQPNDLYNEELVRIKIIKKYKLSTQRIKKIVLIKRSIDSRKSPLYRLRYDVYLDEEPTVTPMLISSYKSVTNADSVIIVGAGPAGYFAALMCIEKGLKPIVIERGKDVKSRRRDLRNVHKEGIVDPDSNYCFGEGGAGTYSDGKLYTRSHKRGKIKHILQLLVEHGADPDILIDAHPHIGSNKLPKIIVNIRETILKYGGEVHFETKMTELLLKDRKIIGIKTLDGKEWKSNSVILATGHSAREIFYYLHENNIKIEPKPFALGVRVEHPQVMIDEAQYGQKKRHENLPAASYSLACQVDGIGVYSFCMCPGGLIVPAATAPGEIVINGMSLSQRNSKYANSGIVSAISLKELANWGYEGVFAALDFQADIEQNMFEYGDGSQKAPAQRLTDFIRAVKSETLAKSSYMPGLVSAPLHEMFPPELYDRLRKALMNFSNKIKMFASSEANVVAPESRTSSPIRIPRDRESYMHVDIEGLYPCGEGAGYAGGILSAAMDGENVVKKIAEIIN